MKSLTKSIPSNLIDKDVQFQLWWPVAGMLGDAQSAFVGLCTSGGKEWCAR
jgi:hypothetical protein